MPIQCSSVEGQNSLFANIPYFVAKGAVPLVHLLVVLFLGEFDSVHDIRLELLLGSLAKGFPVCLQHLFAWVLQRLRTRLLVQPIERTVSEDVALLCCQAIVVLHRIQLPRQG